MEFTAHDLIASHPHAPLGPGDTAPPFALRDQWGRLVSLYEVSGEHPVVLFFYPKDYVPSLALEFIAYRAIYAPCEALGAVVIGVTQADAELYATSAALQTLPFKLLTDPRHAVRDRFGAPSMHGGRESRVTYVIGEDGVIKAVFRGDTVVREQLVAVLKR
jgi:peroxiredoxin Q/BCP